jgi:hypothetical protein
MGNLLNMFRPKQEVNPVLDLRKEMARRQSQTAQLLRQFKLKKVLTTRDLQRIGTGCSSRLHELRKEGHIIVQQYESQGLHSYHYKGQKRV